MKVNVLLSSYNGEKYIKQQIESILNQSSSCEISLWVRDDGSTDKTQAILEGYQKRGLLRWYTGENLGPAKSFFDLIYNCDHADYYAFADQDDIWLPTKIQRAIEYLMKNNGCSLYFSNAELLINEHRTNLLVYSRPQIHFDLPTVSCNGGMLGCTMVFDNALRDVVISHKKPQHIFMHDYYLLVLCSAINGRIFYDNHVTMLYRQHSNNVVGVKKDIISVLKNRISDIFTVRQVSIANQSKDILNIYGDILGVQSKKWLNTVANYRNSLSSRIKLAFNQEVEFYSFSMAIKIRLALLLGNR